MINKYNTSVKKIDNTYFKISFVFYRKIICIEDQAYTCIEKFMFKDS